MNFNRFSNISLDIIKEFIYEAKRNSFALTDSKVSLPDQTSVYSYRQFSSKRFGGMIYTDTYNGNTVEGGQESVSIDLIIRWRNQYYGGTKASFQHGVDSFFSANQHIEETFDRFPEIVSTFLKKALLNTPKEFPVRGPCEYYLDRVKYNENEIQGEWVYKNKWKHVKIHHSDDPFTSYIGEEIVIYNGVEVYWHGYHGGLVQDKYFPYIIE